MEEVQKVKILIVGLPGSDKTTQGKLLAEHLGIPHVSTGNEIRRIVNEDSPKELATEIKKAWKAGKGWQPLVNETIKKVAIHCLGSLDAFVLDGYPRSASQVSECEIQFTHIIHLAVGEEECRRRVSSRCRQDDSLVKMEERLRVEAQRFPDLLEYLAAHWQVNHINGDGFPGSHRPPNGGGMP